MKFVQFWRETSLNSKYDQSLYKDYLRYKGNPYNTYSHKGLPPGPINNPGFDAIKAAAYPAKTNFLFFVAKGNNQHHFTKNERDHINAKNKYLKDDVYVIDCIDKLKILSNINRIKFNDLMEYINNFYKYYL